MTFVLLTYFLCGTHSAVPFGLWRPSSSVMGRIVSGESLRQELLDGFRCEFSYLCGALSFAG